jgi:hypothetical protein
MHLGAKKTEVKKMVYTIDERQLVRLRSVMRCFSQIREVKDPDTQSEILTNAQIILTTFILDLKPLGLKPALPAES